MSTPTHPLMTTIPRGVDTKYFDEQTAPQGRFANPYKVLQADYLRFDRHNPGNQIIIGKIDDQLIAYEDDRHLMTTGGNRSGKSVLLQGNLLFYQGSTFNTDSKGELAEKTAEKRAAMGHKPVLVDPYNVVKGKASKYRCTYNPMKKLTLDNPYIIEDALQIATGIVKTTGQEKEPHWDESATQIIQSVELMVALLPGLEDKERNLINVKYFLDRALSITSLPHPTNEGETINQWFLLHKAEQCQQFYKDHKDDLIADAVEAMMFGIKGLYEKATEERGGILSTVSRHTRFLSFRGMKNILVEDGNSFDLSDYKEGDQEIDLYLVLPASMMEICSRWFRIMIYQFVDTMERIPQVPKHRILMSLDEFPVLGYMAKLEQSVGYLAGFGIRMWIIKQDRAQGKALYKDRWDSFEANCGCQIYFANTDLTTTEHISKRLGQTLIQQTRKSETTVQQRSDGLSGDINNMQGYPLMTPNEIEKTFARDDPQKRQLVFIAGKNPMILQRYEYYLEGQV